MSRIGWTAVDAIAARGMMLLVMLIAARTVGAHEFGELTAVLGTVTLFGAIVAEAMRVTAAKQIAAADPASLNVVFSVVAFASIASSVCVAGLLWLSAPWIAESILGAPKLASYMQAGALLVLLETIGASQRGVLMGLGDIRSMAGASVLGGAAALCMCVLLVSNASIEIVLAIVIAATSLGVIVRAVQIARRMRAKAIRFTRDIPPGDLAVLWKFSFPAMLNSLTWAPVNWLGMAMLARTPAGFAEIGMLGIANQWFSLLLFLPNIVANASLPILAQTYAARSHEAFGRALKTAMRGNLLLAVPAAGIIAAASPLILRLYGPGYEQAQLTLILMAFAAAAASIGNLCGFVFASQERMWSAFATGCLWAVGYLAIAFVCVSAGWGAAGLALATLVSYLFKLAIQLWLLRRV